MIVETFRKEALRWRETKNSTRLK